MRIQSKSCNGRFANRFSRMRKLPERTSKKKVNAYMSNVAEEEEVLSERYKRTCNEMNIKCNSELIKIFEFQYAYNGLTKLNLSNNYLGYNGILPLAILLSDMKELIEINLSQNGLRNKSVVALCDAVKQNYLNGGKVNSLILSNNCISHEAAVALKELLLENRNIVHIELSNTKIDIVERAELQELIEQNRLATKELHQECEKSNQDALAQLNVNKPTICHLKKFKEEFRAIYKYMQILES